MRLPGNSSKNKAQISPSSDNLSYDDTSSPFSSSDYAQQVPVSSNDNDNGQSVTGATKKPSAKQGNRKRNYANQNNQKHGDTNTASAPVSKGLVALLVVVIVIAGMVIFSHHSSNSSANDYSNYLDSRQKKLDKQKENSDIVDKASAVYTKEIFDPESQAVQAVYPIIESVGINGESQTVNQTDLDKLRSAVTKLGSSSKEFTKTQAYSQSREVRKAYKTYQDKKKSYIIVLNNFADAAVGYAATAKNCQENTMIPPMMGEDPNYFENTQNLITNCLTSAQSIAQSKDPVIKKYATATVKRMGDAQKQFDGIKTLGSWDDIIDDKTKLDRYDDMDEKLRDDLYKAETYGNQNPLYRELTNARPDKELENLDTLLYDIAR